VAGKNLSLSPGLGKKGGFAKVSEMVYNQQEKWGEK